MKNTDRILTNDEAAQYSPAALAFLGDSVYERLVRTELLLDANMPPDKLHKLAVKIVCAKYQAQAAHFLLEGYFNEKEEYFFKRGRNSNGINAPRSATNADYRAATGLETVFGYLALTGQDKRCAELYKTIRDNIKE